MAKIRVLLADDHAILRAGLRLLVNAQPDMEVVGEAADCSESLRMVRSLRPDVLTLDLTMPGPSSIHVIERLRKESPRTRVLVLTMHDDPAYLRAVMAAGGAGYLTKSVVDTKLMDAIRAAHQGQIVIDVNLPPDAVGDAPAGTRSAEPTGAAGARSVGYNGLSQREREVFRLLAEGHTNRDIAERLFLSVKTIETYRGRIADKLGLRSRPDLVRYALEIGLLTPGQLHRKSQGK